MADETNVGTAVVEQPATEQPEPQPEAVAAEAEPEPPKPEPTEHEKQIKRAERKVEGLDEEIRALERRYSLDDKQPADLWRKARTAQVNGTLEDLQARDAQQRQALLLEKLTEQQTLAVMRQQDQQQPQPIQWNQDQYEQIREQVRIEEGYRLRAEAAAKQHADWETTIASVADNDVELPTEVAGTIMRLPNGPEVAYALAKNPDEARELAKMPIEMALAKVGRLSAEVEAGKNVEPTKTRAPKPLSPVTKPAATAHFDPNDIQQAERMSADDWAKARNQQLRERGRR